MINGVLRGHYTIESFYDRKLWFLLWCLTLFLSLNSCFFIVYFRYILECDILWMYLFLPYCVRKWHNKTVQSIYMIYYKQRVRNIDKFISMCKSMDFFFNSGIDCAWFSGIFLYAIKSVDFNRISSVVPPIVKENKVILVMFLLKTSCAHMI